MIDLHTHTLFSDGVLVPAELARRAEFLGLKAIGMTDHGDSSNIDFIIPRIVTAADELNRVLSITVVPGIEITHVPPVLIADTCEKARTLGARIIIVHGETLAEPVAPGTNRSALLSPIDILAHPGLITEEEADIAKERGVCLEITTRKGHSLANGHVARLASGRGAKLILATDTHAPEDLVPLNQAKKIALGAGLTEHDFQKLVENSREIIKKIIPDRRY